LIKSATTIDNEFSLLRLVPAVTRARDFRLYTAGGRLVDLWQNGGAAVLGHTPPSLLKELKNTASRGLYPPLPHFSEGRYIKALTRVFPGRNFRLYSCPPPELKELFTKNTAALWRPFINPTAPLSVPENSPPVLIPVVPGIQGWSNGLPAGLCVVAVDPGFENKLTPGDFLSPVLLAVAARGLYDLTAAATERASPSFPRIAKALQNGECRWQRQGIYLSPKQELSKEEWAELFRCFLEKGFLLPPVSYQPAILPGILSPGEEAKLGEVL
jgi:hypothetical protein